MDQTAAIKTVDVLKQVEATLADHFFKDKDRTCQACKKGEMHLRLGKFGPFLGCNQYPDCKNMISLSVSSAETSDVSADSSEFPRTLGEDPNLKKIITVRKGALWFLFAMGGRIKSQNDYHCRIVSERELPLHKRLNWANFL